MQEYLFKIGDKVRIKEGTEYYIYSSSNNPNDMDGVVIELKDIYDAPYKYRVQWNNSEVNSYRDSDLVLASFKKFELIPAINDIILVDDMIDDGESVCKIVDIKSNEYEIEVLYGGFSIDDDWISKDRIIEVLSKKGIEQYLIDWGIKYKIGDTIFYDGIESKVLGFDTQLNEYHLDFDRYVNKIALEDGSIKVAVKSLEVENAELKAEILLLKKQYDDLTYFANDTSKKYVNLKKEYDERNRFIAELQRKIYDLTPKAVIAPINEDKIKTKRKRVL